MSKADDFMDGLIKTNKYHTFFTEWEKARRYQDYYKDELALLSVLSGSDDTERELRRLLKTYPRINSLLPLLNAVRPKQDRKSDTPSLLVLDENTTEDVQYFFADNNLTELDINSTITFAKKTGLLEELPRITNHYDYYFGVEVGMDTNTRKNRSGDAMEALVEPYLREFVLKYGGQLETQMKFKKASELFGVECPPDQKNKKGDFMLHIKGIPVNIEANYFDDSGSKQEIMNSYISRAEDLARAGWKFALVTDGLGWRANRAQVELGYKRIGNILNLKMCSDGDLEELLT